MFQEILTLSDTAQYLKISQKTIRRLIEDDAIPCAKVGGQWRFMKTMIDDWLRSQMKVVPHQDYLNALQNQKDSFSLGTLIQPSCVNLDLTEATPNQILRKLSEVLQQCGAVSDTEQFLSQLIKREQLMSTGVGKGIAIPHPRKSGQPPVLRSAIAVGYSPRGVSFNSLDGKKTHLFFAIASDSESMHLKMQSMIIRIAGEDDFLDSVRLIKRPADFIRFMVEKEKAFTIPS